MSDDELDELTELCKRREGIQEALDAIDERIVEIAKRRDDRATAAAQARYKKSRNEPKKHVRK